MRENIISIVGLSGTGKTQLIQGLIREFKQRDLRSAVVKFARHGFSAGPETKDSHTYWNAGAAGVALLGPGQWALFKASDEPAPTPREIASKFFVDADVILVEGGKREKGIPKIEVLRRGVSEELTALPEDVVAIVTDMKMIKDIPAFKPGQIAEIADFILQTFR